MVKIPQRSLAYCLSMLSIAGWYELCSIKPEMQQILNSSETHNDTRFSELCAIFSEVYNHSVLAINATKTLTHSLYVPMRHRIHAAIYFESVREPFYSNS